ncbi:hypothetical protein ES703_104187 [subsurface metagenome]
MQLPQGYITLHWAYVSVDFPQNGHGLSSTDPLQMKEKTIIHLSSNCAVFTLLRNTYEGAIILSLAINRNDLHFIRSL